MIFAVLHIIGYTAFSYVVVRAVPAVDSRRRSRKHHALLLRITKLETELGLGVFWAKDELDVFEPMRSRPQVPGYSSLHEYAFRCYGCKDIVIYANYNKAPLNSVRDKKHIFCNACLPSPVEVAA